MLEKRDVYLFQLIKFKDKPLIKVLSGMRRCGKSSLLILFESYLLANAVAPDHIIRMNFESLEYDDLTSYKQLYAYLQKKIAKDKGTYYLLLDEIQQVESWERVVNSLQVDYPVDMYLTGSNAYLLSSELSTLLAGRYVEIPMQPLSFKEYLDFVGHEGSVSLSDRFTDYLTYGGLPTVIQLMDQKETINAFLSGVVNTVILKDVVQRNQVRDPALLESLLKYIAANIGNIVSTKKIADYLNSSGRKTTSDTIDNYLGMLESAYIIHRANRYDLKGKLFLKTFEKYYIADLGIRNQLVGSRNTDYGQILENIVFMELKHRQYTVSIGKVGTLEVDFIAIRPGRKIYIQVSATILDDTTRERELRPLLAIEDQYDKMILTMDYTFSKDFEGIKVVNILDFLLDDET
ncbi:ATP-binding protein [Sphaerochaeta sp. PS]|uniref:ATP-binding protein n=1 Tax=Sphaerochaeta sp. PS TaxID=3076336 RepID=UPI0028A4FAE6|nr:ATP-binding protein [Sphaerochaeta sp. PS]MDT4763067.1 ATP-binding protein [Sphaerochaeta sp. PS]